MGYYLNTLICRTTEARLITTRYSMARSVMLGQGISLVPMTAQLFDQMNNYAMAPDVGDLVYLTEYMEQLLLQAMGNTRMAYVEAEYFGGQGGQSAVIWDSNERVQLLHSGAGRINEVLRWFGVVADPGKDEFLTLHLDRTPLIGWKMPVELPASRYYY